MTMKMDKISFYKKILFEFISISFAVFLGLMLNQWKDNYNNRKIASQSIRNIREEIMENSQKVTKMLNSHKLLLKRMEDMLGKQVVHPNYSDSSLNLQFQLINSTAWETSKLTQAIAHMNIEMVSDIAGVYEFQDYYEVTIKQYVLNEMSDEPLEMNNASNRILLIKTKNFLNGRIIPSESNLLLYYKRLLTEVITSGVSKK